MPTANNYATDGVHEFCFVGPRVFKYEDGEWVLQEASAPVFAKFVPDLVDIAAPIDHPFVAVKKGLARVLVEKANPYHDARGRFTSRAGAGFVSLWGKNSANIDAETNLGANAKASQHHKQKVKEFSHILGVHVRGGGSLTDAFGKNAVSMAQLHAEGAKAYGTHSVKNIGQGSRRSIDADIASAYAKSNLTSAQKIKAGIPLTDAEKKAIEKSKEYDKKYYSKQQAAKAKADLEALSEKVAKLSQEPGYEKNPEYVKATKKITKAVALGQKHGASPEEMTAALTAGHNKVVSAKDTAKKELSDAIMAMHVAAGKGTAITEAEGVGNMMVKHEGTLTHAEMAEVGKVTAALYAAKKQSSYDMVAKAYADYKPLMPPGLLSAAEHAKNLGIPEADITMAYDAYKSAHKAHTDAYGLKSANDAAGHGSALAEAKKATGKEPVSDPVQLTAKPTMAEALTGVSSKPAVAKPAEFKAPKTKAEALEAAKALGKQFYLVQQGKYPNASKTNPPKELADAHALYEKAKDAYVALGGSKSEFGSISSSLKSQVKDEIQAAKNKVEYAKDEAKLKVSQAYKAYYDAKKFKGASHPETLALEKAMKAADKAAKGTLTQEEINSAGGAGVSKHLDEYASKKASALQSVHDAAYALHTATIKHKKDPNNDEVLKAASDYDALVTHYAGSKLFTTSELIATTAEAKAKSKANLKAQEEFSKKFGDAGKVAASYDKQDATFLYRNGDSGFAKHGSAQIAKLTSEEKSVIQSYTGAGFRELNKAVGKAGTAKMSGGTAAPLNSSAALKMKRMDAVFAKTTLGANVRLRRNMPQKYFWEQLGVGLSKVSTMTQQDLDKFVGKVYKETAYSSTSMRKDFSILFSGEAVNTGAATLYIRAGASMPGLRAKEISSHSGEDEVILPRGTTYIIRKITKSKDSDFKFDIHVDMVGAFPDAL